MQTLPTLARRARYRLASWLAPTPERRQAAALMHYLNGYLAQRLSSQATYAGFGDQYAEPILQMTQRLGGFGLLHETQLLLWHAMRQYSPTLDAAIRNRRALEGFAVVESDDEGLARALNDFGEDVAVGFLAGRASLRGINTYAGLLAGAADEYGMTAGEIQTDPRGSEISRLVVPNTRSLSIADHDQDGLYELYQTRKGKQERIDDHPFVQVLSFTATDESPWPPPMAWSAVKSTEVVLRMFEAVANGWWRFGDPSLILGMEFDKEATPDMVPVMDVPSGPGGQTQAVEAPASLLLTKETVEAVMAARRQGKVGDAFVSVKGGKLINQVLGDVDQTLMRFFKEQAHVFDSHIVALSQTPVWMYPSLLLTGDGLGGQKSQNEALMASVAAEKRNAVKARILREVFDTYLLLMGDGRFVGKYDLAFSCASIIDEKVRAETRKTEAEADAQIIENSFQLYPPDDAPEDEDEFAARLTPEQEAYLREKGVLPRI